MITIQEFCNLHSISDRDRWVMNKMYKGQEKTQENWVKELSGKFVFNLPEKNITFVKESKKVASKITKK